MHRIGSLSFITAVAMTGLGLVVSRPLSPAAAQPAANDSLMPFVSYAGAFSAVEDSRILRITDEETFKRLWIEHRGEGIEKNARDWEVIPQVDFHRCMVVARFRGDSWNCDGEFVVSVDDRDDDVRLRFDSITFQTAGIDGGGMKVTPYGIWVLPRTEKPLVIEENTQNLIGGDPIWTERARFEGLED